MQLDQGTSSIQAVQPKRLMYESVLRNILFSLKFYRLNIERELIVLITAFTL